MISTTAAPPLVGGPQHRTPVRPGVLRPGRAPYLLTAALSLAVAVAAVPTLAVPALLSGPAVAQGNLRGTALIMLVLGLPTLAAATLLTARGSVRALVGWLGTLGYLLYQAVMFCFATPMNSLFLTYVAFLGAALWTGGAVLRSVDIAAFQARVSPAMPARWLGGIALGIAGLNAVAWLAPIVRALLSGRPASMLDGSGLPINPVYVQDLAIWLPLFAVAAVGCWRRRPWGLLLTGAMLAMTSLEAAGIAGDQWFGASADPTTPLASMAMVPIFAGAAVLIAAVLGLFCRHLDHDRPR